MILIEGRDITSDYIFFCMLAEFDSIEKDFSAFTIVFVLNFLYITTTVMITRKSA
jgi:hypothetical protein